MHFQTTLLCAVWAAASVFAAPEPEEAKARDFPGDFAGGFVPTGLPGFVSLIPTSVWTDPSAVQSAYSAIHAGSYPPWFSSLPPDAKSYFSSWGNGHGPWPTDDGSWPTGWSSDWPSSWSSGWSSNWGSSSSWSTYTQATPAPNVTKKATPTVASATIATANANFAVKPTGMVAASFAGVMGVLGAAIML